MYAYQSDHYMTCALSPAVLVGVALLPSLSRQVFEVLDDFCHMEVEGSGQLLPGRALLVSCAACHPAQAPDGMRPPSRWAVGVHFRAFPT